MSISIPCPFRMRERLLDHRQRLEAEEVELHQARLLDVFHRVLGDQHLGARVAVERHDLDQRLAPDHDAGGMGGGVAVEPLHLQRDLEQPRHLLVVVAHLLQARLALDRLRQRHGLGRVERDQGGDAVDLAIGHAEHAADVAHRRLGLQLAEGDDLRDAVGAVFAHGRSWITSSRRSWQKSMSKSGIDTRSGFRKRSNSRPKRSGSRSVISSAQAATEPAPDPRPGPDRDALRLRPLDEVGDDQEVAREAHLLDHAELVVEPLAVDVALASRACAWAIEALLQPLASPCRAPSRPRSCRGGPWGRSAARASATSAITAQRRAMASVLSQASGRSANSARIAAAGLNQCSGVTRRRSRLGQGAALGDAEQRVMRLVHLGLGEIDVVGGDDRQAGLRRPAPAAPARSRASIGQAVAVQFHRQAVGEGLLQRGQQPRGGVAPALRQQPRERAGACRRSAGSAPAACAQQGRSRMQGSARGIARQVARPRRAAGGCRAPPHPSPARRSGRAAARVGLAAGRRPRRGRGRAGSP